MEDLLNLKLFFIYLKKFWFTIIISLAISLGIVYFISLYDVPTYHVKATILRKGGEVDPAAKLLEGSAMGGGSKNNLVNEVLLFKSFPMISAALTKMNWQVTYYEKKRFVMKELYNSSPIRVTTLNSEEERYPTSVWFECFIRDTISYEMWKGSIWEKGDIEKVGDFKFGDVVNIDNFNYKIDFVQNIQNDNLVGNTYGFHLNDLFGTTRFHSNKLNVQPVVSRSTILELSTSGENKERELAFLNSVLTTILEQDEEQKNYNASKTIEFINKQLTQNTDSLKRIENSMKGFRNRNALIGLNTEGETAFAKLTELEGQKELIELETQYYDYLEETIEGDGDIIAPSSYGVNNEVLATMIGQLIELQLEVNLYTKREQNSKNPVYQQKLQVIEELKLNILAHIENQRKTKEITLNDLDRRINSYTSSLRKLPAAELELANIERKYTLSENVYTMLMQKKIEAGISKAATQSDYQIVHKPYVDGASYANNRLNYIIAVILGIGIPIALIYFIPKYLDQRIYQKSDIDVNVPIIASIPKVDARGSSLEEDPFLIEAFRNVRANLQFIPQINNSKIISITSHQSGDGKSFCANTLANVLVMQGKKVLLIDTDLRKNKRDDKKSKSQIRLTSYLSGKVGIKDIVQDISSQNTDLYRITAGRIPPNPSELILSERFSDLIESLKTTFDFIIIDTAPIGIFSDAMSIMKLSDVNLFVLKEGHTNKRGIKEIADVNTAHKFKNLYFLYNSSTETIKKYYQYDYYKKQYNKKSKVADGLLFD